MSIDWILINLGHRFLFPHVGNVAHVRGCCIVDDVQFLWLGRWEGGSIYNVREKELTCVKQLGVIAQEQQQLNRLQYHDIVSKTFATAFKTYGIAQQRSPASPLPRYIWQDFRVQIPGTKLINIHVMVHGSLLVQIVGDSIFEPVVQILLLFSPSFSCCFVEYSRLFNSNNFLHLSRDD